MHHADSILRIRTCFAEGRGCCGCRDQAVAADDAAATSGVRGVAEMLAAEHLLARCAADGRQVESAADDAAATSGVRGVAETWAADCLLTRWAADGRR